MVLGTNGPSDYKLTNATYHPGILRHPAPSGNKRKHSPQKPVKILTELVQVAAPGETVVDAFIGSGSTGVTCIERGRKFIGVERTQPTSASPANESAKRLQPSPPKRMTIRD